MAMTNPFYVSINEYIIPLVDHFREPTAQWWEALLEAMEEFVDLIALPDQRQIG